MEWVSQGPMGGNADSFSAEPTAMSGDGNRIVFETAENLTADDTDYKTRDIYLREGGVDDAPLHRPARRQQRRLRRRGRGPVRRRAADRVPDAGEADRRRHRRAVRPLRPRRRADREGHAGQRRVRAQVLGCLERRRHGRVHHPGAPDGRRHRHARRRLPRVGRRHRARVHRAARRQQPRPPGRLGAERDRRRRAVHVRRRHAHRVQHLRAADARRHRPPERLLPVDALGRAEGHAGQRRVRPDGLGAVRHRARRLTGRRASRVPDPRAPDRGRHRRPPGSV